jgi:hypothetical protein
VRRRCPPPALLRDPRRVTGRLSVCAPPLRVRRCCSGHWESRSEVRRVSLVEEDPLAVRKIEFHRSPGACVTDGWCMTLAPLWPLHSRWLGTLRRIIAQAAPPQISGGSLAVACRFPITAMAFNRSAPRRTVRSSPRLAAVRYALRVTSSAADEEAAARRHRAANRGRMTGRVLALGEEEPAEAPPQTSAERISLLVELTEAAWAMTGQPWPSLPRAQWPGRVRLLGEVP